MSNDNYGRKGDEAVTKTLGEWQVKTSLPARFRQQVWQRIESQGAAPSAWQVLAHWFETTFAKPAVAVAYVAVLVGVGVTLGFTKAQTKAAHLETTLGTLYVQAVDPYQAPRR